MKNIFLILPFILMGCAELSQGYISKPSETVRNDKCEEIQKYKIFQVVENGALALACDSEFGVETCYGLTVFVPKQKDVELYDDKIIVPKYNQCIEYNGVYKYTTQKDFNKTVPKLKSADKRIANPAYTEWLNSQPAN